MHTSFQRSVCETHAWSIVTLISDSVAVRQEQSDFMQSGMFETFIAEQVVALGACVAAKLEGLVYMPAFNSLLEKFLAERIVTLMSGSTAVSLEQANFMQAPSGRVRLSLPSDRDPYEQM